MSATQTWSGPVAVKSRSSRSGAGRASWSLCVVFVHLRRLTPRMPAPRITRATRFRLALAPLDGRSACTRGAPYVPSLSSWIAWIVSRSAAFAFARSEGARFSQA